MQRWYCVILFIVAGWIVPVTELSGQAPCITASAGADDTLCTGQCATVVASFTGPVGTTNYVSSAITYQPHPFTGGSTVLANLDDAWSPAINLPFCFEFYGTVYNQIIIGTNGLVSFDVAQANGVCPWTINVAAPNVALPLNCIMAPYHDIDPMIATTAGSTEISWQVFGTAPCREFAITWNDIAMYGNGCSALTSTSQVVLHESTYIIDIFIQEKSVCNTWNNGAAIEGLHNANGTVATIVPGRNYPAQWTANLDGKRFYPWGAPNCTFQWFDPSNALISNSLSAYVCPAQTSTYTLQVTFNTCAGPVVITDQVTLVVVQSALTAVDTSVPPPCNAGCNGTIDIFASNGIPPYTYSWTSNLPPVPNQSGLCSGVYTCIITDATGCSFQVSINLVAPPLFTLTIGATPSLCNASTGTAAVSVIGGTGPFTYVWNNGDTTAAISNLAPGSYEVVVTDSFGCSDSLFVIVQPSGLFASVQIVPLLCNGDCDAIATITPLNGQAPYTYQWTSGDSTATATGLCAGTYVCTLTDAQGCTTPISVTIASPPPLVVVPSANMTICDGQSATLTVNVTGGTAPYSYAWDNNLPNAPTHIVTPQQTDVYSVIVTDANGCPSPQQSTQVKVNPVPFANFFCSPASCPPVDIYFANTTDTAISYQWFFGDPGSGPNDSSQLANASHVYTASGTYNITLVATNVWGCSDTIVLPCVTIPTVPEAELSATVEQMTTIDPTTVFMNGTNNAINYCIYFGDGDSLCTTSMGPYVHTYDSIGTFTVMLVAWSAAGCPDTTWLTILVEEPTTCFIPNAFTPDGSGNNDVFMVSGINVREFELLIFDRWGMLIFSTTDPLHGWDGTFKGNKCQEDVYVWRLKYSDTYGIRTEKMGHVSLIR